MLCSREQYNERSPDLCSNEDDIVNCERNDVSTEFCGNEYGSISTDDDKETSTSHPIEKTEKSINRRIQNLLNGILPPPSVTFIQHDVRNMLELYKKNITIIENSVSIVETRDDVDAESSFMPKELKDVEWPEIYRSNSYGVHYNRTKYTESIEMQYMKLVERNVGQETGSSFTSNVPSSAKKKQTRKL